MFWSDAVKKLYQMFDFCDGLVTHQRLEFITKCWELARFWLQQNYVKVNKKRSFRHCSAHKGHVFCFCFCFRFRFVCLFVCLFGWLVGWMVGLLFFLPTIIDSRLLISLLFKKNKEALKWQIQTNILRQTKNTSFWGLSYNFTLWFQSSPVGRAVRPLLPNQLINQLVFPKPMIRYPLGP